jgi:hypothetical protein
MKYSHWTILVLFILLTTNLLAQDNLELLTNHQWLSTSRGFHKNYLFEFNEGKIKSEFSAPDWSKYILKSGQLTIYNNDNVVYKDVYQNLPKDFNVDMSPYDTARFNIIKLDIDSLILEPINLRAREISYYFNRRTFKKDSTSTKNPGMVKFYNRKLSYQNIQFDSLVLTDAYKTITIDFKGNYVVKWTNKSKHRVKLISREQLDNLNELIDKSNIAYFKTVDVFEHRVDIKGIREWKKLILRINNKNESFQVKTDYKEIPWTIKPVIDFIEGLNNK